MAHLTKYVILVFPISRIPIFQLNFELLFALFFVLETKIKRTYICRKFVQIRQYFRIQLIIRT